MPLYRTSGVLTGHIADENVAEAQAYLTQDDMTQYLDAELQGLVEHIEWRLEADGHSWSVTAFVPGYMGLSESHLKALSEWVSGQNSDGLGESFEQQDFAWETPDDCFCDDEDECDGYMCRENGGRMTSFDWETNDCTFVRIK